MTAVLARPRSLVVAVCFALVATSWTTLSGGADRTTTSQTKAGAASPAQGVEQAAARFEANRGQVDDSVLFLSRGRDYTAFFTSAGPVLSDGGRSVRIRFAGARANPKVDGGEQLGGVTNYYRGDVAITGIRSFRTVRYRELYPGIDALYYITDAGELEYDFIVAPGADPSAIRMRVDGGSGLSIDDDGGLRLDGHVLRQSPPRTYQTIDGQRRIVPSSYVLRSAREVGFSVGTYDARRRLVIDPKIRWSTYLGGDGADAGYSIHVNDKGETVVVGWTDSVDFPVVDDIMGDRPARDVFVTRLNSKATKILFSTYLGGGDDDEGRSVTVDDDGRIYLTGFTDSTDYPSTAGAFRRDLPGRDAFVTKLEPDGKLVWSTYLGGEGDDVGESIATDRPGSPYVTGSTTSADFPTTAGILQPNDQPGRDAFVTKLSDDASDLSWSTYLGGAGADDGLDITIKGLNAFVVGGTSSDDFPTTAGAFQAADPDLGGSDAFVLQLTIAAGGTIYSTYLGGSDSDVAKDVAVEGANAFVTGTTSSDDYPTTGGAFQVLPDGPSDAFVTKVGDGGGALVYSTYLGGAQDEEGESIAVNNEGLAFVCGQTFSIDFPTTADAFDPGDNPGPDPFFTKLSRKGGSLKSSTYFGDTGDGICRNVKTKGSGVFLTGETNSTSFPLVGQPLFGDQGGLDAFVIKFKIRA
jgi:hypothetical protein